MLQTGQLLRHDRSCATTLVRRMKLEENNYNRMRYSLETEQLYTTSCGNCLHARARSKMDSTSKCERFESKARWKRKLLDYSISKIVRLLLSSWTLRGNESNFHECLDHYDFLIFFPIVIISRFVISFKWNILLHYSEGYRVIFLLTQWKKC